jgi:hypothetical protein
MKRKPLLYLFIGLLPFQLFAQVKSGMLAMYGNSTCSAIVQAKDGGYALAGYTSSYGAGGTDMYVSKFDVWGANLQWTRTIGGTGSENINAIINSADSGFILVGTTSSFGAGGEDVYVVKLNSSGNTVWTRTIGGPANDGGYSIVQAKDGGYVISGFTLSYGSPNGNVYIIKIDASGTVQWTKSIANNVADTDFASGSYTQNSIIEPCADGGYLNISNDSGMTNLRVIKIDSIGNVKWNKELKTLCGAYHISCLATRLNNGNYAIVTNNGGYITELSIIMVIDSSCKVIASKDLGGVTHYFTATFGISPTHDGGFIITGDSRSDDPHSAGGMFSGKYDSLANLQGGFSANGYVFNFEPVYSFSGNCIVENKDHGFALGASAAKPFNLLVVDSLYYSCVTATNGSSVLPNQLDTVINVTVPAITGGIVGLGGIAGTGGVDTVVCKILGDENIASQLNEINIFPNPSNGKFTIHSSVASGQSSVGIYNVLGEKIYSTAFSTLHSQLFPEGSIWTIDLSSQPSGVYMYRVLNNAGALIGSGKLVIEK